jgi:hydroxyacylglutathione hydrolase
MLNISPIPAFNDNYIWALHHDRHAVLVDPGDAEPCIRFLEQHQLTLSAILITHHHGDHVGGNAALFSRFRPRIYGPRQEAIPCMTDPVTEGDHIDLPELDLAFSVLSTPGHTLGHIAYYGANRLFCGDTLFACGCGRLFEGTPAMMLASLNRLAQLPDNTEIFCAHEYTLSNMSFAKSVDPRNEALAKQERVAQTKRQAGQPTLPSAIGMEKAINPFLRCREPDLIRTVESWLGKPPQDEVEVFAELRKAKNNF